MYVNQEHETRDADLGYIKIYLEFLHEFIIKSGTLPEKTSLLIKEAHDKIQEAYQGIINA